MLRRAPHQTARQLAETIKRAVIRLDPAGAEQRRMRALADRTVQYAQLDDGLAELRLVHTADVVATIRARVDAAAASLPKEDCRTVDQQRSDLLADALLCALGREQLPTRHGRHPSVQVVVQLSTLLGADDDPAHLDGYGPITAGMAREIAADPTGTWRRLLTDPSTGHLVDAGTATYRPSRHLIGFLKARDGGCTFSTCHAPPERCEVEHCIPHPRGGSERRNTALTCRRHNEIKKSGAPWRYRINGNDTTTWTHTALTHSLDSHPPQRWTAPSELMPVEPAGAASDAPPF